MHAQRNYHIIRAILIVAVAVAGYSFYKLSAVGLADPNAAQRWFGLMLATICISIVATVIFYYCRAQLSHAGNDEIAIQALAAAGRNAAKTNPQPTPAAQQPTAAKPTNKTNA